MKILMLGNQRRYRGRGRGYSSIWNEEFFREELARRADVDFYGWGYDPEWVGYKNITVPEIIERFGKPDVLLNHYHRDDYQGFGDVEDVLRVWVAGDFYEENWRFSSYSKHAKRNNYDISCGYSPYIVDFLRKHKVGKRQYFLPWGVDTYNHRDLRLPRTIDVSAIYSPVSSGGLHVYPYRRKIYEMLKTINDINVFTENVYFDEYVLKLNQSKISINDNGYFKFVNPRVAEVIACGALLLTDRSDDFANFGYVEGEHLAFYNDVNDLREKIIYYLKNEDERRKIADNGMKFVRENYSNGRRAERLLSAIRENL